MHNADVLVHDDSTVDDLIDVVEGTISVIKEIENTLNACIVTIKLIQFQWKRSI
jgi:ribosome-interacting GTPase 1